MPTSSIVAGADTDMGASRFAFFFLFSLRAFVRVPQVMCMLNEEYGVRAGTDYDLSGHPWNAVGLPRDPFECDFSSNDAYIGLETGWSSVVGYFRRAGSSCTWTSDGVTSTNGCLCKELAGHRARPRQPFTLHRQCIWSLVPNIRPRARVGGWEVGGGSATRPVRFYDETTQACKTTSRQFLAKR